MAADRLGQWPQLEQDPERQLVHAAAEVVWRDTPDMPKVDGSFSTSVDPQLGHVTDDVAENINRSNRSPHAAHSYSNTGTGMLLFHIPRQYTLDPAC